MALFKGYVVIYLTISAVIYIASYIVYEVLFIGNFRNGRV